MVIWELGTVVWLVVVSCSQVLIFDTARQDTAREGGGGAGNAGGVRQGVWAGEEREREHTRWGSVLHEWDWEDEVVVRWLWKFAEWRSKIRRK